MLPADGVQQVIHILLPERRLHLSIDRDGIREVRLRKNELILQIENRTSNVHKLTLTLTGDINRDVILTICPAACSNRIMPLTNAGKTGVLLPAQGR